MHAVVLKGQVPLVGLEQQVVMRPAPVESGTANTPSPRLAGLLRSDRLGKLFSGVVVGDRNGRGFGATSSSSSDSGGIGGGPGNDVGYGTLHGGCAWNDEGESISKSTETRSHLLTYLAVWHSFLRLLFVTAVVGPKLVRVRVRAAAVHEKWAVNDNDGWCHAKEGRKRVAAITPPKQGSTKKLVHAQGKAGLVGFVVTFFGFNNQTERQLNK